MLLPRMFNMKQFFIFREYVFLTNHETQVQLHKTFAIIGWLTKYNSSILSP